MENCIFCKIAKGEIPCVKIWEDENFLAFLDIMPSVEGMTLVIPKKHYESNLSKIPDKVYSDLFLAAKKVTLLLEKGLKVERVAIVVEGLDVSHAHIKLYPVYKIGTGYHCVSPDAGSKKSSEELGLVAEKIRSNSLR